MVWGALFPGQGVWRNFQRSGPQADLPVLAKTGEILDMPSSDWAAFLEGKFSCSEFEQPAIVALGFQRFHQAITEVAADPLFLMGHSLGEITGLACAGALSLEQALVLVRERGRVMDRASARRPGGMLAIEGMARAAVAQLCKQVSTDGSTVVIANVNSGDQIVISGDLSLIGPAQEAVGLAGGTATPLCVSGAYHSPLMAPALAEFENVLEVVAIREPQRPVISPQTGRIVRSREEVFHLLRSQFCDPVDLVLGFEIALGMGPVVLIDIGPGTVMKHLSSRVMREKGMETERLTFDDAVARASSDEFGKLIRAAMMQRHILRLQAARGGRIADAHVTELVGELSAMHSASPPERLDRDREAGLLDRVQIAIVRKTGTTG